MCECECVRVCCKNGNFRICVRVYMCIYMTLNSCMDVCVSV